MARVLITGATGFTGRYLLRRLARDGHELHGIVRDCHESDPLLANVHTVDLQDYDGLRQVVWRVRPELVVHLAAIAFVAHGSVTELYASNILGTRNLLHALTSCANPPRAVLLASSANVYGNRLEGVLTEDMPAMPSNDYGVTKASCELLANAYSDRLPIVVVRPFNYTGVGQSENFIIPKIIAHSRARKAIIELGNLDVARDFSDVRAVTDCYARLLETPAAIGGLFNVCSGRAFSLDYVIAMVESLTGHHMEVRVNPAFVRPDEVKSLHGSPAKLEALIGSLDMPALRETIEWMLDGDH